MKKNGPLLLGLLGALNTLVVGLYFAQFQSPLFPLPGLYLLEIGLVGIIGLTSLAAGSRLYLPWIASGILLAFVLLGAWTIGFFLVPGMLAFGAGGTLSLWGSPRQTLRFAAYGLAAALVQGGLILGLARVA